MSVDLSAAITTFVSESKELLADMENSLLDMEASDAGADQEETINAIFRAIHTIKGSAGLFGFDYVVSLTHIAETVLDDVRNGNREMSKALLSLYLETGDLCEELILLAASDSEPSAQQLTQLTDLSGQFHEFIDDAASPQDNIVTSDSPKLPQNGIWFVCFVPNENVLRNGLDPFPFIHFLNNEVTELEVATNVVPLNAQTPYDPESCYLAFLMLFRTSQNKEAIEEVFEFIKNDAVIEILPPEQCSYDAIQACARYFPEPSQFQSTLSQLTQSLLPNEPSAPAPDDDPITAPIKDKKKNKLHSSKTLRVEAMKLDRLIDQVGEMVITGARTNLLAHETGNETLIEAMALLERLVENIRDSSLKLRMVQIGETFNKFKRVVRDVADELGKEVELNIIGADTELDKTFVEKVSDPLMHIIRNAIDHGIETPDERVAAGKSACGQLTLKAYHDSGSIVIEIQDDGQGLDQSKILARAIENGLISAEHSLQDKEINLLIFEPGFSTAAAVTSISGRGVGMDVVKRNVESLRGSVEVDSTKGLGSKIIIRLPLTLSIIDGFMFTVGDEDYVIPLDTVVECLELHEVVSESDIQDKNYINLRTEVLPFIRLRSLFGIEQQIEHTKESLVIVQFGTLRAGLVVDSLQGEFQTVVKPLGRLFEGLKCISGATILGSGKVAIILDVSALIRTAITMYEQLELKH
ncbi:chemotaxis protein CheA [Pseudoalteromonas ardens]|uniref:Chemotaxis protein CheA n=1 Tax=Pseudoalteromonas rubra TaxID=43658 RepID=A0A0L0EV06_9GAMM|nr:chemotaxis protein CheA [Pseudoalteromonas sp. R96]KNC68259.1 chemotaxis protein CheA [Pseudoalteromonas rubra]MDK1313613.1 chemotaxis protein CheA [Pseudoalteromonas sp. R96]